MLIASARNCIQQASMLSFIFAAILAISRRHRPGHLVSLPALCAHRLELHRESEMNTDALSAGCARCARCAVKSALGDARGRSAEVLAACSCTEAQRLGEAQAAVAVRDAVIADQLLQIDILTERVASINLGAGGFAAAAAAGPPQAAAARGAAAMATREVGGGRHTSIVNVNVTLPAMSGGSVATVSTASGSVTVSSSSLHPLPKGIAKCGQQSCTAVMPRDGIVFMTKSGQRYHTCSECSSIRGREVQTFRLG